MRVSFLAQSAWKRRQQKRQAERQAKKLRFHHIVRSFPKSGMGPWSL
jgi:hypothetical protein